VDAAVIRTFEDLDADLSRPQLEPVAGADQRLGLAAEILEAVPHPEQDTTGGLAVVRE
jgi:hypothetical protein